MEEEVVREEEREETKPEEPEEKKEEPEKAKEKPGEVVEKKPWTRWKRGERKEHLKISKHGPREKWFVLVLFSILFIIFLAALFYSIVQQMDPAIIITLIAIILIIFIAGVFLINHIWYDTE